MTRKKAVFLTVLIWSGVPAGVFLFMALSTAYPHQVKSVFTWIAFWLITIVIGVIIVLGLNATYQSFRERP